MLFVLLFIHIRPRGSHDSADIKGSRPTARPPLLSRQRRHVILVHKTLK